MIVVEDLRRRFGDVQAVDGVSFTARDGEITGLLGPNGAGKTTTLRMLIGLLKPDAGSIRIDEVDAVAEPMQARRRLGVLPDGRGLYQRLTARENIEYFGRLHGLRGTALRERCDALIAALALDDIAARRTEGFSQGQRVKTAIARALVHAPQNIVLDEPGNGLDVLATRALRDFLRQQRDAGRCVVLSSHVMTEVAMLCDRVIVVAAGRVVAEGTPAELQARSGMSSLEEAFIHAIGSAEGLAT